MAKTQKEITVKVLGQTLKIKINEEAVVVSRIKWDDKMNTNIVVNQVIVRKKQVKN